MPWSNGVFSRYYPSWSNDAANNLAISASKFDGEDTDFATGISFCLSKDGLSGPQQAMTWGLTSAQVLQLNRGSDGAVFGIGRTGGSNNPTFKFSVADAGGLSLASTSQAASTPVLTIGAGATNLTQALSASTVLLSYGSVLLTNTAEISSANQLSVGTNAATSLGLFTNAVQRLTVSSAGIFNFIAPSAGQTVAINGAAGAYTLGIQGSLTTGSSSGLAIHAGTNSSDVALTVSNAGIFNTLFNITGAGASSFTAAAAVPALTVNGFSNTTSFTVNSANAATYPISDLVINRNGSTPNSVGLGSCLNLGDQTNQTFSLLQQSGGQTEMWQYNGGWNQIFRVTTARTLTIANSGAPGLNVTGGGNSVAAQISSNVVGYAPLYLTAASNTSPLFQFSQGVTTGSATPTLGSNKPGSNTSVGTWIVVSINSVTYYIPAWS